MLEPPPKPGVHPNPIAQAVSGHIDRYVAGSALFSEESATADRHPKPHPNPSPSPSPSPNPSPNPNPNPKPDPDPDPDPNQESATATYMAERAAKAAAALQQAQP